MRWDLIEKFDRLLDSAGNSALDPGEVRRRLTVWELRRQVKIVFYKEDDEDRVNEVYYMWVDHRDIQELIEYLKSGQRNNYESNEELELMIVELEGILNWIINYPHIAEKD